MDAGSSVVYVVDDEDSVRRSLERLLRSAGFSVHAFALAHDFLATPREPSDASCLILDVRMPAMTGLQLQEELRSGGADLPTIFVSGHGNIPISVQAMKAGAVTFLTKPFDEHDLLAAVTEALQQDRATREQRRQLAGAKARSAVLSAREAEVFHLVVRGLLNKQIADQLGIREKTVKVHRARVMEKMQAQSLAELVRMSALLEAQEGEPATAPAERGA
jgi:FixJ family two-component response regulator